MTNKWPFHNAMSPIDKTINFTMKKGILTSVYKEYKE
jgi:hypothetical protein